jgi:pentatricopeptide repeat protein
MTLVTALIVGYLGLSLLATIILISACVVGGRFDKANKLFSDPMQQSNAIEVMPESKAETSTEAKVALGELNRLMPQLIHQVTE